MKENQCDTCLYLDYDEEVDEYYCSLTFDQDDMEKLSYRRNASCPYYRYGDEYSIVKRQAVK